jgi:hypothetical protein
VAATGDAGLGGTASTCEVCGGAGQPCCGTGGGDTRTCSGGLTCTGGGDSATCR